MTFKGNSDAVWGLLSTMNVYDFQMLESDFGQKPWKLQVYSWFGFDSKDLKFWIYGYLTPIDRNSLREVNPELNTYISQP